MANKRVSELQDATLPTLGTDKILISRDGFTLGKTDAVNLPISNAVRTALDGKLELSQSQVAAAATGVVSSTDDGDIVDVNGNILVPSMEDHILASTDSVPNNYNIHRNPPTDTSLARNYFKFGLYCFEWKTNPPISGTTMTAYYKDIKVGTTKADVE